MRCVTGSWGGWRPSLGGDVTVRGDAGGATAADVSRDRYHSWETDVWLAESPSHLFRFSGERFLGPP